MTENERGTRRGKSYDGGEMKMRIETKMTVDFRMTAGGVWWRMRRREVEGGDTSWRRNVLRDTFGDEKIVKNYSNIKGTVL